MRSIARENVAAKMGEQFSLGKILGIWALVAMRYSRYSTKFDCCGRQEEHHADLVSRCSSPNWRLSGLLRAVGQAAVPGGCRAGSTFL